MRFHISTNFSSTTFLGATNSPHDISLLDGAGNALRSILSFGVNGMTSKNTKADGIIKGGSFSDKKDRNSLDDGGDDGGDGGDGDGDGDVDDDDGDGDDGANTTYAIKRLSPGVSSRATTTTSRHSSRK